MSPTGLGAGAGPVVDRTSSRSRSPWSWADPRVWDRRLVAPGSAWRLVLLRTLILVVIGLRLALRRWWTIADRPADLFDPVPILAWLGGPPGTAAVVVVWLVGLAAVVIALAMTVARRGTEAAFVVAWLALLFLTGLWGSSGKVMHNDVLLLTASFPLLFARSPRATARDRDLRWGWPPRAVLVVVAVVYFLTGYQKLRHSGLEWVFSSNLSWVIRQGANSSPFGPELGRAVADQLWLTQAMAAGALATELAAPLLLVVRRTRLLFALAVLVMHGTIWMFLGLDYYGWVLTVWAAVIPMSVIGDRWAEGRGQPPTVSGSAGAAGPARR